MNKIETKKAVILATMLSIVVISLIGIPDADASIFSDLSIALWAMVESNVEIVEQNRKLISQNNHIIELMMGDRSVYVAGVTERYDLMEYQTYSECRYFDRLLQQERTGTCPITGITKDQFNAMVNAKPER